MMMLLLFICIPFLSICLTGSPFPTLSIYVQNNVRDYLEAEYGMKHRNADLLASFATPMVAQIFSTPFHILSLDIFSRPE